MSIWACVVAVMSAAYSVEPLDLPLPPVRELAASEFSQRFGVYGSGRYVPGDGVYIIEGKVDLIAQEFAHYWEHRHGFHVFPSGKYRTVDSFPTRKASYLCWDAAVR